jgi:hypothetical protein|tara:strand:- start:1096 stop:1407 length:312 start_codon:yes stop_codon:yes gene_type:complete
MEILIGILAVMNVLTIISLVVAKSEYREDIRGLKETVRNELFTYYNRSKLDKICKTLYPRGIDGWNCNINLINDRIDRLPQVKNKKKQDRLEEIKQELESMEE